MSEVNANDDASEPIHARSVLRALAIPVAQ
jgi:hypothetical protein